MNKIETADETLELMRAKLAKQNAVIEKYRCALEEAKQNLQSILSRANSAVEIGIASQAELAIDEINAAIASLTEGGKES